ncbi:MAG: hypothetical protein ABIS38_05670 [Sphingomicrobium sp.]
MMYAKTLLAGASALAAASAFAAAPVKAPPPIADYWMDVTTSSGFGAGMTAGAQPSMDQIMAMMSGGGGGVGHTLDLRLASKTKPAGAPQADHFVPPALRMGPSLPLIAPLRAEPAKTGDFPRPQGKMLIYWGCGEHVGAGQPLAIDYSKLAAGVMPPAMKAMSGAAHAVSGPTGAPGFGRWPNDRDPRALPPSSSVLGAHRIAGNYSPEIAFTLGQDFMPGLNFAEAGALPSGAARLRWTPIAPATGYALAMFGSNGGGDVIVWSSATSASMPVLDYLAPGEVKRLVGVGAVLPPSTSECVMPAEVAAASPMGMVTMIGYGPEAHFSDSPKAPTWTARVRYKSTASVMRGMQGMISGE